MKKKDFADPYRISMALPFLEILNHRKKTQQRIVRRARLMDAIILFCPTVTFRIFGAKLLKT